MGGYIASSKVKVFLAARDMLSIPSFGYSGKLYGLKKYSLPDLQHFLRQLYHGKSVYNSITTPTRIRGAVRSMCLFYGIFFMINNNTQRQITRRDEA